ncbi:MAG: hypothetical protein P1V81_06820 [Planctomycetota bacterium]|nr:hypothetical protein [Planctomycetota bacterium]
MQEGESSQRRWFVLGVILVAVLAIVPSIGTLDAGLISDDGAALGYVHREGPLADFTGPQYDLRTFRFWRPLVTASLGVQEAMTGVAPVPLRLFNLFGHVAAALLLIAIARRLGVNRVGSLVVGALAATFPYQGGTVTWIVGRVDTQTVPWILACLLALLSGRRWWAAAACALAMASKETAVVTPFLGLVLVWAQTMQQEEAERTPWSARLALLAPSFATFAVVFVLRRLAIGDWIGGYPGGLSNVLASGSLWDVTWSCIMAALGSLSGLAAGLVVVTLLVYGQGLTKGWSGGTRQAAVLLGASVLCLALALGPVVTNLTLGEVAGEHQRTLYLADCLGALGIGALFVAGGGAGRRLAALGIGAGLGLIAQRSHEAWVDTHDWAIAGRQADALVAGVHASLASAEPSTRPVLSSSPPVAWNGCYVLKWGVPDRFRAPFPESPRPVWPWRPLFEGGEQLRSSVTVPKSHLRWPFGEAPRTVPLLRVTEGSSSPDGGQAPTGAGGVLIEELHLGAELLTEPGPLLHCEGYFPGARFEALLFTEQGYGVGLFGGPKRGGAMEAPSAGEAAPPFGGAISLRELLQLTPLGTGTGGPPLFEVVALAADLGATEGYLELRATDDARGKTNRAVGASQWIHLTWDPELRDVLKPWDSF